MGTTYNIKISKSIKSNEVKILKYKIDSLLLDINMMFSTYIDSSEISRFNKADKKLVISQQFIDLFNRSKEIYDETDGAFDPSVQPLVNLWGFGNQGKVNLIPVDSVIQNIIKNSSYTEVILNKFELIKLNKLVEIDFSAIAKGYGVDRLSQFLKGKNIENFMVEIGGEVVCNGKNFGKTWKIGLQNPFSDNSSENILEIIKLENKAMATSGNYRNFFEMDGQLYSHMINPRTGYPIKNNLRSVTVITNNCLDADAYATALMVMGTTQGLRFVENHKNIEAIFITGNMDDYRLIKSSGIKKIIKG
ncbi:MAG: FAD:protein FMN transferase [Candidatus Neomarinimicrobiota bacterium]|nr:FAD:protein FMN transferase [Candidatus Neomarinimicrobiota bacterium]